MLPKGGEQIIIITVRTAVLVTRELLKTRHGVMMLFASGSECNILNRLNSVKLSHKRWTEQQGQANRRF